ncbi:MAG: MBL fold metallo-hydrolase [Bdellovibrionota bacterium]
MSVEAGVVWNWKDWTIQGLSLSGIRTSFLLPQLNIVWDVAQGYPFALHAKKYFLSHGHLDHAAGVPYILSQKAMNSAPKAKFYMPESLIEPLTRIMRIWEEIEKHEYEFDFLPAKDQQPIEINKGYDIEPFKTIHRVDSFGYTLVEKKTRLKAEYAGKTETELKEIRASGAQLAEKIRTPLISFTGDTQIEFLDVSPQTKNSKCLIMECTYLDDRKTIENAKKWGHTHLDELIERLDDVHAEKIVIIHISSRYSTDEARKIIQKRVPKAHQERIEIFPGR